MKINIKYLLKGIARALALTVSLALMLAACGGGGESDGTDNSDSTVAEPDEPSMKVGFIYSGNLGNGTINKIFNDARLQLEKNLGVETCYIEGVLVSDFPNAVDKLIKEHDVTVIVSCSDFFANSCDKAASDYTDVSFICFGGDKSYPNLTCFQPLLYQPANICGLAAAIEQGSVGVVADHRMYNYAGVINSYILGAKLINQANLDVAINWARSDSRQDTIKAIDDIVAQGHEIVMLYQSTDYGIRYCEENNIKFIAFANNLEEIAPKNYVTGFYFNVNSFITEQVRLIQNEMFTGSVTPGELKEGKTRVTPLNEAINDYDSVKYLTDTLYENITRSQDDGIFKGEVKDNFGTIQIPRGVTLGSSEVLNMRWIEISALSNLKRFSEPLTEAQLVPSDLVVHGERPKTEPPAGGDSDDEPPETDTAESSDTSVPTTAPSDAGTPDSSDAGTPDSGM
ncbi:MAG: BMP family ABC transporter substrate-binding protein [Oscillospiraceae bacterium]|jgi:basic membrane lipoprotein Med (substrate-binding protein (PBP1-ABC) superfamily)|nr:BMP family ABC transporter substrate-binding protein [Oscillospiraceae bacterium]